MESLLEGLGFTIGESILALIAIAMTLIAWHVGRLVSKIDAHSDKDDLRFGIVDGALDDGKESFKEVRGSLSKLHQRINDECRGGSKK